MKWRRTLFSWRGLIVAVLAVLACMCGFAFGGRHGTQPLEPVTFWMVGSMGMLFGMTAYIGWLLIRMLPPDTESPPVVTCETCHAECPRGFYVVRGKKLSDTRFYCQKCQRAAAAPYRVDGEQVRIVQ